MEIRMCTVYVRMVYWSVHVISSLMCTVYTLKFSGTYPFFNLMCTHIKHLGKVFIKTPKYTIAQVRFPI